MSWIQKTNVTHSMLATIHLCACVFVIMCVCMFSGQLKLKVLGGRLGSFTITRWSIHVPGSPDTTLLVEYLGQQKQPLVVPEGGSQGQRDTVTFGDFLACREPPSFRFFAGSLLCV